MPETDRAVYRKIHTLLADVVDAVRASDSLGESYDGALTLGFNPNSGVRGNRPKDLWCALFPKNATAYMPQIYAIISDRGIEYGFAAAIHRSDFSDAAFKRKLQSLAPQIFDALPDPASTLVTSLADKLSQAGGWHFRRKTRLMPNQDDFASLADLLAFLKSDEGKQHGAGTISRYVTPAELTNGNGFDLTHALIDAAQLFAPLIAQTSDAATIEPERTVGAEPSVSPPKEAVDIQTRLQRFLEQYPEIRASKSFGVDRELWHTLSGLQHALMRLDPLRAHPHVKASWSVGQGNWARIPWIAFIDERESNSTQHGVYAVFLFREDMSGVYLTLAQGVTKPTREHGRQTGLKLLRENAQGLRQAMPELAAAGFQLSNELDLRTEASLGINYQSTVVAHKLYERDNIPSDADIEADLSVLLDAYNAYIVRKRSARSQPEDSPVDSGPSQPRPIPEAPPFTIEDALRDLFLDQDALANLLMLWRGKKNLILQGAPGVGKTFLARRLAFLILGHKDAARLRMIQFHQAYSYEDFVQGYRPAEGGGFERRDGVFFDFCKLAESEPSRPYVFIIDEINRGNLSKIFGELMMLVEPDKRGEEYAIPLTYSHADEAPFAVPENLYVLGLMNTADRSLSMVDYALRRRFAFATLEPQFGAVKFQAFLKQRGVEASLVDRIVARMRELNAAIAEDRTNLGPGFCIGHSFFTPREGNGIDGFDWYRGVVQNEIKPLLMEYWFDDQDRAEEWAARLLEG